MYMWEDYLFAVSLLTNQLYEKPSMLSLFDDILERNVIIDVTLKNITVLKFCTKRLHFVACDTRPVYIIFEHINHMLFIFFLFAVRNVLLKLNLLFILFGLVSHYISTKCNSVFCK